MSSTFTLSSRTGQGRSWTAAPDVVRISDHLINESKLKPRLAAIYNVKEEKLQCIWTRGQYSVKADKNIFKLNAVGGKIEAAMLSNGYSDTAGKSTPIVMACDLWPHLFSQAVFVLHV